MACTRVVTLKMGGDKLIYSGSRSGKIYCWFQCEGKEKIKGSWLEQLDGLKEKYTEIGKTGKNQGLSLRHRNFKMRAEVVRSYQAIQDPGMRA